MNTLPITPKNFGSIEKRLALYGVAAGAALAAGVPTAEAALITLDLTGQPIANRTTPFAGFLYFDVNAASAATAFGTTSFTAADFRISHPGYPFATATAGTGNGVAAFQGPFFGTKASHLSNSHFVGGSGTLFYSRANIAPKGPWGPNSTGFLGLQFLIGPSSYFGWANITVNTDATVTLNALGYEDTGAPAHAQFGAAVPDEGSTLALLAIGAGGLVAFRKRQRRTV